MGRFGSIFDCSFGWETDVKGLQLQVLATIFCHSSFRRNGKSLPAPTPTASSEQSHNEEQQYRTDSCVDDCTDNSSAQMDANLWQQPIPDEGAHYPEDKVANDSETRTSHNLTG